MVEIDESFKIFQQFRMNNGDSSTGQENEVVDIEKTRTAAGEGSVENERHAGLRNRVMKDAFIFYHSSGKPGLFLILERFILEGRADQSDEFRHFIIEYGQILHDMELPTKYW